ncbi:MAG: DNA alkylation repair protein [Clostridia bacterium]|nr:DNA alkylation repair protein [Clostridia bacterium]
MITDEIRNQLFEVKDEEYRQGQFKLIPNLEPDSFIGVRTPEVRRIARELIRRLDADAFLHDLPHKTFDENQVHALAVSEIRDYERCMAEVQRFLPYVDNWATCDQMIPKVFKKHKQTLMAEIRNWIHSDRPYTVRFAIGQLMHHFLDEDFDDICPAMVASVRSDEYYVNMMIAWYFATALAKQYDAVLPYLQDHLLSQWVHNKTIQKAVESFRITQEQKNELRKLRRPVRRG